MNNLKTYEEYNIEIDPYGEEFWDDENLILVDWNTEIEIGDEVYIRYERTDDVKYLGEIIKIENKKIRSLTGMPDYFDMTYTLRVGNDTREMDMGELIRYKAKIKK
jgi:hypothetical protein